MNGNPPPEIAATGPDWVAAVKPRGLPTVPARGSAAGANLLEWLASEGWDDLRTLGRLDRAAGGLVLLARGAAAQRRLGELWHDPATVKGYLARTIGTPDPAAGAATEPIGPGRKGRMRLGAGKPARTIFATLPPAPGQPAGTALVACRLATGRRHQIRLHLAGRGAPVAGDTLYLRAAERIAGRPSGTPAPRPPDAIDLWCWELALPAAGIDLRSPAPFAPMVDDGPTRRD